MILKNIKIKKTPSPGALALHAFVSAVVQPILPLASKPSRPTPTAQSTLALPKRSSTRLKNNALAKVPAARRGEVLLMRRFDLLANSASPTSAAKRNLNGVSTAVSLALRQRQSTGCSLPNVRARRRNDWPLWLSPFPPSLGCVAAYG